MSYISSNRDPSFIQRCRKKSTERSNMTFSYSYIQGPENRDTIRTIHTQSNRISILELTATQYIHLDFAVLILFSLAFFLGRFPFIHCFMVGISKVEQNSINKRLCYLWEYFSNRLKVYMRISVHFSLSLFSSVSFHNLILCRKKCEWHCLAERLIEESQGYQLKRNNGISGTKNWQPA